MKHKIEKPEFCPITVTFDRQEEVIWLLGIITCNRLSDAVRKVDTEADIFLDNFYNVLKTEDPDCKFNKFSNKIDAEIKGE